MAQVASVGVKCITLGPSKEYTVGKKKKNRMEKRRRQIEKIPLDKPSLQTKNDKWFQPNGPILNGENA